MKRLVFSISLLAGVALSLQAPTSAQSAFTRRSLTAIAGAPLLQSDRDLTALSRSGELQRVGLVADTLVPGREHERWQQTVNGVPVWATTITRQTQSALPVSVFGEVYTGLETLDTTPRLTPEDARARAAADAGVSVGPLATSLYVLVTDVGPRLVYTVRIASPGLAITRYFVDARTGDIVEKRDDTQHEVGTGTGVFGPDKKISTTRFAGSFVTDDSLRPPTLQTFNMRGAAFAVLLLEQGLRELSPSDLASDADNHWTDAAVVDAHVYSGWVYDYLYKRFGRLGLDDHNLPIINIVHPANRSDYSTIGALVPDFFAQASYVGGGVMIYGEGLPAGVTLGGWTWDYTSGALDIVAHELTHGVTDYTSQLEYRGESGALNEAFSDIIGTSVEFFFQPEGAARGQADWLIGEDVVRPGGLRSMANPAAYGGPDHYSHRFTGSTDNGGVHTNSNIVNQAYFLAVVGGRNATSGLSVTGVGLTNREQLEKVFYRAFTTMLPAQARFTTARAATIQAARDLYGAGSTVERAVTDAWTAVGVL